MDTETPRKPGRARLEPEQRVRHVNTSLRPAVVETLRVIGGGSESRGLRIVAERAHEAYTRELDEVRGEMRASIEPEIKANQTI